MKMLKHEIVEYLSKALEKSERTVKKDVYLLTKQYPNCTKNAVAQIYALKHGKSVFRKLDKEDKGSLPNIELEKQKIKIPQKTSRKRESQKIIEFMRYPTNDSFRKAHIEEVNRAYTFKCYTSAFILCRKIIENLLTDIIRRKFPQNRIENIELYFDTARGRTRDFSEILSNLRKKVDSFGPDKTMLERVISRSEQFKDDANDKVHSWYHVVRNRRELDDTNVQDIIDMIIKLEQHLTL
jgi:hypothetical protein